MHKVCFVIRMWLAIRPDLLSFYTQHVPPSNLKDSFGSRYSSPDFVMLDNSSTALYILTDRLSSNNEVNISGGFLCS